MRNWVAIPNFVDTDVFSPCEGMEEREAVRRRLGLPEDAFVVGCVAAIKRDHKRLDYLIREMSAESLSQRRRERRERGDCFLLIAGAGTDDTPNVRELGETALGRRCAIMADVPRERMPEIYRAMDVFVLPSLFEMMPIAVLEALASGLPVIANRHPVLEWMVGEGDECLVDGEVRGQGAEVRGQGAEVRGQRSEVGGQRSEDGRRKTEDGGRKTECREQKTEDKIEHSSPDTQRSVLNVEREAEVAGGVTIDMGQTGALAEELAEITPSWVCEKGAAARARACDVFSREVVVGKYVDYYGRVMAGIGGGKFSR